MKIQKTPSPNPTTVTPAETPRISRGIIVAVVLVLAALVSVCGYLYHARHHNALITSERKIANLNEEFSSFVGADHNIDEYYFVDYTQRMRLDSKRSPDRGPLDEMYSFQIIVGKTGKIGIIGYGIVADDELHFESKPDDDKDIYILVIDSAIAPQEWWDRPVSATPAVVLASPFTRAQMVTLFIPWAPEMDFDAPPEEAYVESAAWYWDGEGYVVFNSRGYGGPIIELPTSDRSDFFSINFTDGSTLLAYPPVVSQIANEAPARGLPPCIQIGILHQLKRPILPIVCYNERMNANEIRKKYLDFQVKHGHKVIPPAPLVLENDPTTLFTGSGMQPLLPYLLGQPHPEGTRLADSQPSMRLQDIEDVGDPRHTTVFEMLGNWSLGDYFKKEQIENYFEFLTKEIGLDPERIYVTCFIGNDKYGIPKDTEAATIWQEVFQKAGIEAKIAEIGSAANGDERGIKPGERIFFYDDKENWWSRGGGIETTPLGDPCGPDSEVFYDFGEDKQDVAKYGKSHPASDGARFMEIGNQVFMQYKRNEDGTFSELEHKNVDFGGGLERLAAAAIGSFDVFKISLMLPIIEKLEAMSHKSYDTNTDEMRIIADHLRGAYLLSAQGLVPSNKAQGYALRRLVRRAILRALDLGIGQDFIAEIIPIIAENYADLSDDILPYRDKVVDVLTTEENAFRRTISKGVRELRKLGADQLLTGQELFKLQDTYGFPLELSVEEAYKLGLKLSPDYQDEFEKALAEQRERSKTASKGMFKGGLSDTSDQTVKYHTACHLLLKALQEVVDPSVSQKGSNLTPERLRFDFNVDHKLTPEELSRIEELVNNWIEADLPVQFDEYDKDYAFDELHANGSFRDRYPDRVTVYTIGVDGEAPVSVEICGGPHVEHTGVLGKFKITKEESSSAGVRRIKAILE